MAWFSDTAKTHKLLPGRILVIALLSLDKPFPLWYTLIRRMLCSEANCNA